MTTSVFSVSRVAPVLAWGLVACAPSGRIDVPKATPAEMADALALSLPLFGTVNEVGTCTITPEISAELVIVNFAADWLPTGSPIAVEAGTSVLVQRSKLSDLEGTILSGAKLNLATYAGDDRLNIDCGGTSPEGMLLATSVIPKDALLAPAPEGFESDDALASFVQERWDFYGAPFEEAVFVQLLIDDDPEGN